MQTKLPLLFLTASNPRAFIHGPTHRPSILQAPSPTMLQAGGPKEQGASDADPLSSIWKGMAEGQRKSVSGQSTRDIIKSGDVVGEGLKKLASDVEDRTKRLGFDTRLVMVSMGDSAPDEVAIGPLAKAYVMKRYEDKYGIALGSVTIKDNMPNIDPKSLTKVAETLKDGKQAGLIVTDQDFTHSATLILKLDPKSEKVHAISLDGLPGGVAATDLDYEYAVEIIADEIGVDFEFKRGSEVQRQTDRSSCNTEACVVARDMLIKKDSNTAVDFQPGQDSPIPTLKTAQRNTFLNKNNYNPEQIYSEVKNRTLGEHRADHTISVDGKDQFLYLRAKTLQYANSTLNWLEGLGDGETAKAAAKDLLDQAYQGSMLDDIPNLLNKNYDENPDHRR